MAFAGSVSFQSYDRYVNKLFSHLSRDPPPGKSRITVSQILAADKQVFVRLIEAGVRHPDKSFPLDSALLAALESYEVSFLLLHESASKPPKRPNPPRIPNAPPKRPRTGKGTGKGQPKHTSASSGARIPKAILDLHQ